jgi:Na+-driven multidrug efflux pump
MDDTNGASFHGTRTLILAGIISISIIIILSLPEKLIIFLAETFKWLGRKEHQRE